MSVIHTVGHSTRTLDAFLALLRAHGITAVVDVRRFPASRRHPHVNREPLADALHEAAIRYVHLPGLGGRRSPRPDSPNTAWRAEAFRGYADHMGSAEFAHALAALVEIAAREPTALLCAEAVPWRCHRSLIADALVARGHTVRHITSDARAEVHRLTPFAVVVDGRVTYPAEQQGLFDPA